MLSPNYQTPTPAPQPVPGRVDFAKWPPDDNMPAGPPAGPPGMPGGGGFDPGYVDFKKGRFKPGLIIVALLAVIAIMILTNRLPF